MKTNFRKEFGIYRKGKVAVQFKLNENIERPGVFMELSDKPRGDGFDWSESSKITVKLGINDLLAIAHCLSSGSESIQLYHDPMAGTGNKGAISKNIQLIRNAKGYYINVSLVEKGKQSRKISVPASHPEIYALVMLFNQAILKILRWD